MSWPADDDGALVSCRSCPQSSRQLRDELLALVPTQARQAEIKIVVNVDAQLYAHKLRSRRLARLRWPPNKQVAVAFRHILRERLSLMLGVIASSEDDLGG